VLTHGWKRERLLRSLAIGKSRVVPSSEASCRQARQLHRVSSTGSARGTPLFSVLTTALERNSPTMQDTHRWCPSGHPTSTRVPPTVWHPEKSHTIRPTSWSSLCVIGVSIERFDVSALRFLLVCAALSILEPKIPEKFSEFSCQSRFSLPIRVQVRYTVGTFSRRCKLLPLLRDREFLKSRRLTPRTGVGIRTH
jgi:hypothetical protein